MEFTMTQPKLFILIGPPGSGKSTYANSMVSEGFIRVSQDDQGKQRHMELFEAALLNRSNIVVDRMNFDRKQRDKYRLEAVKQGYTVNFVEFCVPRQVCFQRCVARVGHPTINEGVLRGVEIQRQTIENSANSALTTFFSRYEPVTEEEGPIEFRSYSAPQKSVAIMCDLDGTLANLSHRLHFVRREGKKDWGSFFRECQKDGLYECVAGVVRNEINSGTEIVYCSGRDEEQCRELTHDWLQSHGFIAPILVMRPKLNYKADNITKIMLYRYEIEPYYNVKYVLDDRDQVVEAWRKLGLVCFQVRPGDF